MISLTIQCKKAEELLTKEELHRLVDADTLKNIKKSKNNTVSIYKVMASGKAEPSPFGGGEHRGELYFSKEAISKAYDKLTIGTPLIKEHRETPSDHPPSIGTVVGKFIKDEALYAITHLYEKSNEYPSISIEAEVLLDNDNNVISFNEVAALALLETAKPAFPDAYKTQSIAAQKYKELNMQEITIQELQNIIVQKKLNPSEVFSLESLTKDPKVSDLLYGYDKKIKDLNEVSEKITIEKKDIEEKFNELQKNNARNTLQKEVLSKIENDKTLSSSKREFMKRQLDTSNYDNLEDFFDNCNSEYDTLSKIFTPTSSESATKEEKSEDDSNEELSTDEIIERISTF